MLDSLRYLLILGACAALTAPLEYRAGVYRRPHRLIATLVPVVLAFGLWDRIAVARGDWWFASRYTIGVHIAGLPIEEWLFFVVIPICAVLTFESLGGARRHRAPREMAMARDDG
jgi:lycopene cyclase domain-containing protein